MRTGLGTLSYYWVVGVHQTVPRTRESEIPPHVGRTEEARRESSAAAARSGLGTVVGRPLDQYHPAVLQKRTFRLGRMTVGPLPSLALSAPAAQSQAQAH